MPGIDDKTVYWRNKPEDRNPGEVLRKVYAALKEKGYSPIDQIVGYLLSGDPTYITSHMGARNLIRRIERDELLEELVRSYLEKVEGSAESRGG
ncbi:MAG: IreB family regulatory phosphoprotein [Symbiobacterium sp.]|jgi:Bacterial protein of unknown function (DUF965).|uniref:IreB family regulatory phosphoprotein n=1 Tax=Symbiobacterium sp. TaxID=1971213 RepID=UPI003463E42A